MITPNRTVALIRDGRMLPELLAPAGSYDALLAAIEGGADAVYMGGVAFNARINAKNFTEDELRKGISLAHSYGVKVYIAANTLIYDRELDGFLRSAEHAYECGADALIIADIGAAREVGKRIPVELHASTQFSGHGAESAKILADAGFSRMVCAREMSKEDIKSFVDVSTLEAEVFVHGALCVCHSGQCLFSSLVGGRSGNRGECAQPCRLPYRVKGGKQEYPLSLKDLTLSRHVTELCELGVSSLKIEGRMKSPEYVRDVTRVWRHLLDGRRNATDDEVRELEAIFSRGGFTDAYFTKSIGHKMLGVRSEEQKRITRELAPFEKTTRKIKIDMDVSINADVPARLTLTRCDNGQSVTVMGDTPQLARTAPIDADTVRRSLLKLGDTPYSAENVRIDMGEGLMLPISSLNALRRKATSELAALNDRALSPITKADNDSPKMTRTPLRTAVFYNTEEIPSSAYSYFDIIYTPLEKYTGNTNGVLLPPVIFDSERETVARMLHTAKERGAEHALVGNFGHSELAREAGLYVHGDLRLNITNSSSAAFAEREEYETFVLSPELSVAAMRDVGGKSLCCVYGRIPLMVTEKCIGKEIGDCKACEGGYMELTDRRGVRFPVMRTFSHRSTVFNSVPVYMADKQAELDRAGLCMRHFIFTVESADEADAVINAYKKSLPPKSTESIKRIK